MLDIIVQQNMALRYTGLRHTALCNKERFQWRDNYTPLQN